MAAKSEQFTAGETGRASSSEESEGIWQQWKLWERFRLQAAYQVCFIFAIIGASGMWKWAKGSVARSGFSERVCRSLQGSPAWPGTHWKLRATRKERESERSYIPQVLWLEKCRSRGKKGKGRLGSARKRADWKWHVLRWEWHHSRPCTSARDSAEKVDEIGPAE